MNATSKEICENNFIFSFHLVDWTVWESPMGGKGKITATEKMFKTAMPFGGVLIFKVSLSFFAHMLPVFLTCVDVHKGGT